VKVSESLSKSVIRSSYTCLVCEELTFLVHLLLDIGIANHGSILVRDVPAKV